MFFRFEEGPLSSDSLTPVDLNLIKDLWVPNVFIYNLKTFKVGRNEFRFYFHVCRQGNLKYFFCKIKVIKTTNKSRNGVFGECY